MVQTLLYDNLGLHCDDRMITLDVTVKPDTGISLAKPALVSAIKPVKLELSRYFGDHTFSLRSVLREF